MSTKELASRIGMTQRNIDVWKSGERGDPPWYVGAVLHYLDCLDRTEAAVATIEHARPK